MLGVTNVILMDYEDGMLTSYPEAQLREEMTIYIRQYQPDVVMSWYPFPIFSLQPMLGWNDLGMHVVWVSGAVLIEMMVAPDRIYQGCCCKTTTTYFICA